MRPSAVCGVVIFFILLEGVDCACEQFGHSSVGTISVFENGTFRDTPDNKNKIDATDIKGISIEPGVDQFGDHFEVSNDGGQWVLKVKPTLSDWYEEQDPGFANVQLVIVYAGCDPEKPDHTVAISGNNIRVPAFATADTTTTIIADTTTTIIADTTTTIIPDTTTTINPDTTTTIIPDTTTTINPDTTTTIIADNTTTTTTESPAEDTNNTAVIVLSVLSVILALVLLAVTLVYIYRYRKNRQTTDYSKGALLEQADPAIKQEEENRDNRLSCNIKSPPSQVQGIHHQIVKMIKATCVANQFELMDDGQNPTLVTVVSQSRAKSDIDRDMTAARLTSSESCNVILLRIIPVRDPNQRVEKMRGENFILDLTFLVDTEKPIQLHDCNHNMEQSKELMDYLLKMKNSSV